jgi:putative ABC transport system permease protein
MLLYNARIAVKSLRRNPVLTLLVLVAIALGTGVATTFAAVRHAFARDPIPEKSAVLRYVRLDSWDPHVRYPGDRPLPPPQLTYRDAMELMRGTIPVRQSAMMRARVAVHPDPATGVRPWSEIARLCFGDFFGMFAVPFRHGGPWTRAQDEAHEEVVVLGEELNERLFGGADSVGRTVRIADRDFRVVGVLGRWDPGVRFYDVTLDPVDRPEQIFFPFNLMAPMQLQTAGNTDNWKPPDTPGFEGVLQSEMIFVEMWVELPSPAADAPYHDYLDAYALGQKKLGRFQRPLDNRASTVAEVLEDFDVVPRNASRLLVVSLLFLAVCCVNLVGVLLGKFLARAAEVGVRRALGASRLDVLLQHLVECAIIGLAGGALGLGLAGAGMAVMNAYLRSTAGRGDFYHLDAPMALLSVGLSLAAALVAGAYPAWRVCRIAPAVHLKIA